MLEIWLIVAFWAIVFSHRTMRSAKEALAATIADCDASEALTNWRSANPDLYIGDVPQVRELVMRRIATWSRFLDMHPSIEDDCFTEFLYSLLDEHEPPPPGDDEDPGPTQPVTTRAVFLPKFRKRAKIKSLMNRVLLVAILALALIAGGIFYFYYYKSTRQVACTLEAKLCPDGSAVGRSGPNCEFAPCPDEKKTDLVNVRGRIILSPICPVEKIPPDPACAPRPYQTLVAVFRESDPVHAVALTTSDKNGTFSLSLEPGKYILGAGESNLPRCETKNIIVEPGAMIDLTLSCDTGIR